MFNNKKIKELNDKLEIYKGRRDSLLKEINIRDEKLDEKQNQINNLKETNNYLEEENKKLLDWIYKILDTFPTTSYPDTHETVCIPIRKDISDRDYMITECNHVSSHTETIIIPKLIIHKQVTDIKRS